MVVAVAEESRGIEGARPWIEQASPGHWSLIDTRHLVASLYGMVNVPQAVWIDEAGRIVRGPETAGSTDHFRRMDRSTRALSPEDQAARLAVRQAYLDSVREWVRFGRHSKAEDAARQGLPTITPAMAEAEARFRLGLRLHARGQASAAARHLTDAARLHPASWNIWRQAADLGAIANAGGAAFWARVDALGEAPYYPQPDLTGLFATGGSHE